MNIPSPFTAVDIEFDNDTEMALLLDNTAGYATISYGPNFPGQGNATTGFTSTGLNNDTTSYTATITIDATGTPHTVSFAANGSTIQTFSALLTALNTALGVNATATMVNGDIVITSATTGANSSVTYVDGTPNPLFGSIKGSTWRFVTSSSVRGASDYAVWNTLDAGTQSNVTTVVNSFLAAATANTNQAWTNGTSTVEFPTGAPTRTTDTGLTYSTVYQLAVTIDGGSPVQLLLNLNPLEGNPSPVTFNKLFQAIGAALAAQGVAASVVPVNTTEVVLVIASNSVGTGSTVVIADGSTNGVLAALAAFGPTIGATTSAGTLTATFKSGTTPASVPAITGNFSFTLAIDGGAATSYNITAANTDSMTALATKMTTAIGAAASVAASGATLVVTSATTGFSSKVVVTHPTTGANPDLFDAIATALTGGVTFAELDGVASGAGVNGTTNVSFPVTKTVTTGINENNNAQVATVFTNWRDVMLGWPSPTGFGALFTTGSSAITKRGNKPSSKGKAVRTAVYYNGTNWVYFDTDAAIGGTGTTVNPPEAARI